MPLSSHRRSTSNVTITYCQINRKAWRLIIALISCEALLMMVDIYMKAYAR